MLSQNRRYGTKLIAGWIQSEPKNSAYIDLGVEAETYLVSTEAGGEGRRRSKPVLNLRAADAGMPRRVHRRSRSSWSFDGASTASLLTAGARIGESAASGEERKQQGEGGDRGFPSTQVSMQALYGLGFSLQAWASSPSCCKPSPRLFFFSFSFFLKDFCLCSNW